MVFVIYFLLTYKLFIWQASFSYKDVRTCFRNFQLVYKSDSYIFCSFMYNFSFLCTFTSQVFQTWIFKKTRETNDNAKNSRLFRPGVNGLPRSSHSNKAQIAWHPQLFGPSPCGMILGHLGEARMAWLLQVVWAKPQWHSLQAIQVKLNIHGLYWGVLVH
jgi:hypothetical protein